MKKELLAIGIYLGLVITAGVGATILWVLGNLSPWIMAILCMTGVLILGYLVFRSDFREGAGEIIGE